MKKRGDNTTLTTLDDFLNHSSSNDSSNQRTSPKTDEEVFEDFVKSQQGKYISKQDDKYIISRTIKGERKIFGHFALYEYAEEYERNLIINGWNDIFTPRQLSPYGKFIRKSDKKFYIIREINGERIKFGPYYKLKVALLKREELIDDNWGSDEELNLQSKGKYGKYITFFSDKYEVNKVIDGQLYNFGYFDTLDDATKARDILLENNWDDSKVPDSLYSWRFFTRYHPLFNSWELFNIIDGDLISFGLYETVEIAKEVLNILIENDWNTSFIPLECLHEYSNIRRFKRPDKYYYSVIRKVNDELLSYGSFEDYDEALKLRNELYMNNWILEEEEEERFNDFIYLKDGKYTVKNNGLVYGEFDTIDDANEFMIECVKKNWKMD